MTPITKLYLKTFLISGIPFGLIMSILGFTSGVLVMILIFFMSTFIFGGLMSLIIVSFHRYKLKKKGVKKITTENIGVSHTRNIKSRINKIELIEILKNDSIFGKMKMKEIENGIHLKTEMTRESWGENIKIILQSNNNSEFEYLVSSSPKIKTTIIDYGKNLENVNLVENILKIEDIEQISLN